MITVGLASLCCGKTSAQTSYSENVVGYTDVELVAGYNLIRHPLDAGDNSISNLFRNLPPGSRFVPWDRTSQSFGPTNTFVPGAGWGPGPAQWGPAEGGFVWVPTPTRLCFAGEPWPSTCFTFPAGLTAAPVLPLLSCALCGGFTDPCPLVPPDGTAVLRWNGAVQDYDEPSTYLAGLGWFPSEPALAPHEAALVQAPVPFTSRAPGFGAPLLQRTPLINPSFNGTNFSFQFFVPWPVSYWVKRNSRADTNGWTTILREPGTTGGGLVTVTDGAATNSVNFYKLEYLRLFNPARSATNFTFQFYADEGIHYQVSRTTSLGGGAWEPVQSLTGPPGGAVLTVTDATMTQPTGYYRVAW